MSAFTGTGTLIRFILRRDRIRLPLWIIGIVGFVLIFASALPGIYPTAEERQARADLWDNPAANLFRGPGHGLEDYRYGVIVAAEILAYVAVAAALMSIFLIVRHTRREEETGRLELFRAGVLGRYAPPAAAFITVTAANVIIGVLIATLLPLVGEDMPFIGSAALGAAVMLSGISFAAVALVIAQLTEHGRGASSLSALILGASFLIRGIGDVQGNVINWFSPIGWSQAMRPFVDERWWSLILGIAFSSVMVALAAVLINRRDVAAGLLPARPGPAEASGFTRHPVGFVARQLRGSLIGWSIGMLVLGATFGSTAGEIGDWINENAELAEFIAAFEGISVLDSFLGFLILTMALLTAGFAIPAVLRAQAEETAGRAEPLLSTALSRQAWFGSYLIVAMIGSAGILLFGGIGLGLLTAIDQNDAGQFWRIIGATLAYVPALWTLIGLTALLYGIIPRLSVAIWAVLLYAIAVGLFGDLLNLPSWSDRLSPFGHVPELPGGEFTAASILVLIIGSGVLLILALAGFRRRDLQTT